MTMLCPCDPNKAFSQCCEPIINQQIKAADPEQLMRSRYSAYATNNAQYIFDTYAAASRLEQSVAQIEQWAGQCQWVQLEIVASGAKDGQSRVEFIAKYLQQNQLFVLHEDSRFILEDRQWRYLDGEIIEHQALVKVKRNDLCPCQSGKKFKQCCG